MTADLSIVIPALNEVRALGALLDDLAPLRAVGAQVIVVDGGSSDGTLGIAGDLAVSSAPGRAIQMNAGAALARGSILWFLHADSRIDSAVVCAWHGLLQRADWQWGRFDVRLSGRDVRLRVIERMIGWRSRLSGIATGDQGIFVRKNLFTAVGAYPEQALMEDVELCKRLRRFERPLCLTAKICTSSRRWEKNGISRTVWLMWGLRLRYWLGAAPADLARRYRRDA